MVQERDGASAVQASLIRDGNIGGILSQFTQNVNLPIQLNLDA